MINSETTEGFKMLMCKKKVMEYFILNCELFLYSSSFELVVQNIHTSYHSARFITFRVNKRGLSKHHWGSPGGGILFFKLANLLFLWCSQQGLLVLNSTIHKERVWNWVLNLSSSFKCSVIQIPSVLLKYNQKPAKKGSSLELHFSSNNNIIN